MVNDNPTNEFRFHKGLHHDDLLSLFLFLFVINSLNIAFRHTMAAIFSQAFRLGQGLFHIFQANDVFIGNWSSSNFSNIVRILHCFRLSSGLKINLQNRLLLGIGVTDSEVYMVAVVMGCRSMTNPKWRVKSLLVGGILTLVKSVLGAIHILRVSF